jgi:general secretion pathway protein E
VVAGRSGAEHDIDILATRDDGIVTHQIAIGIEVATEPVALSKVFAFDDKAYDAGIQDKVFIAVPGLSPEARQFAERQRIRVFEVKELEQSD